MGFDGGPVVWPNFDVHADHTAAVHRPAKRGVKGQTAAVRYSSFDDDVGLDRTNDLLQAEQVFGKLDDWSAQPGESIDVFCVPAAAQPRL